MGFQMQNRWLSRILRVATALAICPMLFAQTPARPEAARSAPNLSGMWKQSYRGLASRYSAEDAPLQPWALGIFKANREGIPDPSNQGLNGMDPKAFTRPWTGKKVLQLNPDWQMMPGLICEDRFKTEFSRKSLRDKPYWVETGK